MEGAQFKLETKDDGGFDLDVKCAANEPMKACADIVNQLLDRIDASAGDSSDL